MQFYPDIIDLCHSVYAESKLLKKVNCKVISRDIMSKVFRRKQFEASEEEMTSHAFDLFFAFFGGNIVGEKPPEFQKSVADIREIGKMSLFKWKILFL